MSFQSIEYLLFLSIVFILYWTLCSKSKSLQNALIVVSSIVFYGWWDWRFLGLLLLTVFSTYIAGILERCLPNQTKKKVVLVTAIILNLGILFFFKYYNFFVESLTDALSLLNVHINELTVKIILPIGISFYTFSALSYIIDVYQHKVEPTRDVLAYMSYIMFFPSILSGPINRAQKQLPQYFEKRIFDYDNVINACTTILWGAVMKLCLADRLGIYVNTVYSNLGQHNGTTLLFASLLYSVQIYADFAGYSLIAIGSGKLLGINLQNNFLRPCFANSISDFWRRWHISLSTWFRDYIYFPLGGSRCSRARWMFNIMVVFVVSGLWHGATYGFLIWGTLHGVGMIVERMIYGDRLKKLSNKFSATNCLRWVVTFLFVSLVRIFFCMRNLDTVALTFKKIFTEFGNIYIDLNTLSMALVSLIIVLVNDLSEEYDCKIHLLRSKNIVIKCLTAALLICYILAFGVLNSGSFIYFQF